MQPAQCMLLFLVLAGNSALFRFVRSYMLLLYSRPFLCALELEHIGCNGLLKYIVNIRLLQLKLLIMTTSKNKCHFFSRSTCYE